MNRIDDDISNKNQINATLKAFKIQKNKLTSKVRCKIARYFGIADKYYGAVKTGLRAILRES